jgi:hypothetical protein
VRAKTWSIRLAEVVDAAPERVMAWWFDPDRKDDLERRIVGRGATDFALSESIADGRNIRTITFRNARGWDHRHRVERDETPQRNGGRFIVSIGDVNEMLLPRGQRMTLRCEGRLEFISQPGGSTEVNVEHDHTLTGGNWATRRAIWLSDPTNEDRLFKEMIARCQANTP